MTTKELSTYPISKLRPMLSEVGITGLRRQSLNKESAVQLLHMHYADGLVGELSTQP